MIPQLDRPAARRRAVLTVCSTALALAAVATPAAAATRHLAPGGNDAGACDAAAPCASFARAYEVAAPGDVVQVAAGTYGEQRVPGGDKPVTFHGGPGVVLRQMSSDASNVTYDGINVDAGGVQPNGAAFGLSGSGSTVKNASIGNLADEKAMLASGANHTIDNVTFHDAVLTSPGQSADVHMECLYAIVVPGFTIRNSTFRDCAIMDLFFTYGNWWSPLPPAYGNVTVENNVFGHPEETNNGGWHYYGMYIAHIGPNGAGDPVSGWVVRNNTFENDVFIAPDSGANGTRWVNNIGAWDCKPGIAFRHNVGDRCGDTDRRVSPAASNAGARAPFGFTDPATSDFTLRAGSPAINAGDPADSPATDRRGWARDGRPDAGAFEFGATGPPGAGGSPPPRPGGTCSCAGAVTSAAAARAGRPRLRVRLSSRTICVRGCPKVARLRVRVSEKSRVRVRVRRVGRGRKAKRVMAFSRPVRAKRTLKLRARKLGRGRYRILVTARDASGRTSKAKRLRLRVR